MNEPRRLSQSGGIAQRLLDSASLDRPGPAARRHAAALGATANAFARSSSGGSGTYRASGRSARSPKTLAWVVFGAAASVALGVVGSRLLAPSSASRAEEPLASLPTLSAPAAAARSPDIAAEPATPRQHAAQPAPAAAASDNAVPTHIEPWVPSPSIAPLVAPGLGAPRPRVASSDEVHAIEAARDAVSRGDADSAIAQLNAYDSAHPSGQLKPEAMVLRIQALSNSGKAAQARALANEFQTKYPQHPLTGRVRDGVSK